MAIIYQDQIIPKSNEEQLNECLKQIKKNKESVITFEIKTAQLNKENI